LDFSLKKFIPGSTSLTCGRGLEANLPCNTSSHYWYKDEYIKTALKHGSYFLLIINRHRKTTPTNIIVLSCSLVLDYQWKKTTPTFKIPLKLETTSNVELIAYWCGGAGTHNIIIEYSN